LSVGDHVLSAITDFEFLLNSLEKREGSKVGGSFRSRCRELPTLIEDVGLVPALSYCYAKAGKGVYDTIKRMLKEGGKISDGDSTEKGYGIYLYFTLKRLKDLKLLEESHLDDPIKAFEELQKGKQRVASKLLSPYLIQMKRLSEAIFKAEGE
jgi:CRISPR type III-B/RAMP module-associated protein Cmr5